jgi:hypothetical protein
MAKLKKTGIFCSLILVLTLLAGTAFAGPVLTFGPNDEGVVKFEYKGQFSLTARDTGSGANGDENTNTFAFRRNRFAIMGAYGDNFSLYVNTDYSADNDMTSFSVTDGGGDSFRVIDAVFRFKMNDDFNVWAGQFKYSLTRENLEACEKPLTLDRSVLIHGPWDPYNISRDEGFAVWGNLLDDKFQYRFNVMEGRSDASKSPESAFRYGGRVHVTLLDPEKKHGYKGTYLGKKKVLTIGAGYQFENDVAFEDTVAQTGSINFSAWTADLYFEYPLEEIGTFTFSTAYTDYDFEDAITKSAPDPQTGGPYGEKDGYYVKAGYMLPQIPLQFFARYEDWALAEYGGILDQDINWYGAGLHYYFRGQDLKLSLEYNTTDFDKENANVEDFNTITTQLQVMF